MRLVKVLLDKIINGFKFSSKKQNKKDVSYSLWRMIDDYVINWEKIHPTSNGLLML